MTDIGTRDDLERLLRDFYSIALDDPPIAHHFLELDLEGHLPVIVDFWEKVLFGTPVYSNNPLAVHQRLHEKSPLKFEHFDRWVEIFSESVDRLFSGANADEAKSRARAIAASLGQRLNGGIAIHRAR